MNHFFLSEREEKQSSIIRQWLQWLENNLDNLGRIVYVFVQADVEILIPFCLDIAPVLPHATNEQIGFGECEINILVTNFGNKFWEQILGTNFGNKF